jgi:hypothetical protein
MSSALMPIVWPLLRRKVKYTTIALTAITCPSTVKLRPAAPPKSSPIASSAPAGMRRSR